jgi:hypothetical protein
MVASSPIFSYLATAHPLGELLSLRDSWGVQGVVAVEREAIHAAAQKLRKTEKRV